MHNAIAVIPARGGSKRLPGKNIMDFMGQPMIGHTIAAAQQSGLFKRILVSTDSPEIAKIALDLGADVPFLREKYSDDLAPVSQATCASVKQAISYFDEHYDIVAQLMPNCPIRNAHNIAMLMNQFTNTNAPYVISAFKYGFMNPRWAVTLDSYGHPTHIHDVAVNSRSQEQPELFCASGAVWIGLWSQLEKEETFFGNGHIYHPIPWENALDIDDNDDLRLARAVYTMLTQENHKQR